MTYHILLIEASLPPMESITMTRYLMYKCKINDMGDQRLPKISLNSSQDHPRLKKGQHKYNVAWLNYWGVNETATLQNINKIKNTITSNLKEKLWGEKDLEVKRKLRYYKEVINPNLEDQNHLSILTMLKKKPNIDKIRTNSHQLHSEIGHWTITKTPWEDRIHYIFETKIIENECHFHIEFLAHNHIT